MTIQAVFFDVGETLVDETRQWGLWADWLGVPRLTFFAALGAVIERGEPHRKVFDAFRAEFDLDAATFARAAAGLDYVVGAGDLYPDALPTLLALKAGGYAVGIAGNQPETIEAELLALGAPCDWMASSARWGVEKPSPAFFDRIVAETGLAAAQIAYVGDRLDNDVLPALQSGMTAVFIERGPWGVVHARQAAVAKAHLHIRRLDELPAALDALRT